MDKEIKDLLLDMAKDIKGLKEDVNSLKQGQLRLEEKVDKIDKKLNSVEEQTADLAEFRTEVNYKLDQVNGNILDIKKDINRIEGATVDNWSDIVKLKKKMLS